MSAAGWWWWLSRLHVFLASVSLATYVCVSDGTLIPVFILWQGIGSTGLEWISDRFTSFSEKIGKSLDQLGSKLVLDFCAKSMHNQYLESA